MKITRISLSTWLFISASFVVCALALVTGFTLNNQERERASVEARLQANGLAEQLGERMTRYFGQLEVTSLSLAAIISSNPGITDTEYADVAQRLSDALPEVINVAAAPDNVVQFVNPVEPNVQVLGLDYNADPTVMAIIMRIRQSRRPEIQGPVSLAQGGVGFIVRTPVYVSGEDQRIERYWGVVALVIDHNGLLDAIGLGDHLDSWSVSVSRVDAGGQLGQLLYGSGAIFPEDAASLTISELGTEWQISVLPVGGWPSRAENANGTWIVLGGTAMFLVFMFHTFMRLFNDREVAQRRLLLAIESLEDGFALFDENDRLVLFNQRIREIYTTIADRIVPGVRFEDILRVGVERGQFPEAAGCEEQWISARMQAHAAGDSVLEQHQNDGRWLKIAERKTPDGGTVGFRVDITELKTSLERAEAANQAKSEFLQVVSHELRTPLTAVIGFLSFLTRPELLPASRAFEAGLDDVDTDRDSLRQLNQDQLRAISKFAQRAQTSSDHLLRLISDVLEWSKLEQHVLELDLLPVNSTQFVEDLRHQFEQLAQSKGLNFRTDIAEVEFSADPDRLKQAVINLVGNAIKFTKVGEVVLLVEEEAGTVRFRVQDSGPGIPSEVQKDIFERFFQVDTSSTRSHGGIGLGLSISKHLIELHGGTISVYSELGQGSEFTITIPKRQRKKIAA